MHRGLLYRFHLYTVSVLCLMRFYHTSDFDNCITHPTSIWTPPPFSLGFDQGRPHECSSKVGQISHQNTDYTAYNTFFSSEERKKRNKEKKKSCFTTEMGGITNRWVSPFVHFVVSSRPQNLQTLIPCQRSRRMNLTRRSLIPKSPSSPFLT